MLDPINIPARNLQKSYKSIIEGVKSQNRPVILTTNQKPQAAIVSLEDLEKLNKAKGRLAGLALLKLAYDNREEFKNLPADLREKANEILYTK